MLSAKAQCMEQAAASCMLYCSALCPMAPGLRPLNRELVHMSHVAKITTEENTHKKSSCSLTEWERPDKGKLHFHMASILSNHQQAYSQSAHSGLDPHLLFYSVAKLMLRWHGCFWTLSQRTWACIQISPQNTSTPQSKGWSIVTDAERLFLG